MYSIDFLTQIVLRSMVQLKTLLMDTKSVYSLTALRRLKFCWAVKLLGHSFLLPRLKFLDSDIFCLWLTS